ncbi:hypothetical protein TYRP_002709 [Tyrophagus putrescentiae]|nr:hypothetical protein TYRP_002709 [Tyrophagus putrescentiae]
MPGTTGGGGRGGGTAPTNVPAAAVAAAEVEATTTAGGAEIGSEVEFSCSGEPSKTDLNPSSNLSPASSLCRLRKSFGGWPLAEPEETSLLKSMRMSSSLKRAAAVVVVRSLKAEHIRRLNGVLQVHLLNELRIAPRLLPHRVHVPGVDEAVLQRLADVTVVQRSQVFGNAPRKEANVEGALVLPLPPVVLGEALHHLNLIAGGHLQKTLAWLHGEDDVEEVLLPLVIAPLGRLQQPSGRRSAHAHLRVGEILEDDILEVLHLGHVDRLDGVVEVLQLHLLQQAEQRVGALGFAGDGGGGGGS